MCARIAIISDTHFGDTDCNLVTGIQNSYSTTPTFDRFKKVIEDNGPIDYLVLNGDTLDFSISSFDEACAKSRPFFEALVKMTKKIVYIPGNHDKQVWDATEWQRHVIMKLHEKENPEPFVHAQPGIIDLADGGINLPGVSVNKETKDYGGMYLEGLLPGGCKVPIYIVYPNLFIKNGENTTLVTHGHFLEVAWVLLSELIKDSPKLANATDINQIEEYNFPINTMICTGLGTGGPITTELFKAVQKEAKQQKTQTLDQAIDIIRKNIKEIFGSGWSTGWIYDAVICLLKSWADNKIRGYEDSRYSKSFLNKVDVQKRFARYYEASCKQAAGLGLAAPKTVIFGHTHEVREAPVSYPLPESGIPPMTSMYNTGGWLKDTGAAVFFLDSDCKVPKSEIIK